MKRLAGVIRFVWSKRLLVVGHDLVWVPLALSLAFWLRFNLEPLEPRFQTTLIQMVFIALPVHAASFWIFGCYRGIWRFASLPDLLRLLKAVMVGAVATGAVLFIYSRFEGVPRSVVVLYPLLLFVGAASSRVVNRVIRMHALNIEPRDREKALIVGAGRAGNLLIRDLLEHGPFVPSGIVDDDPGKWGTEIHGIRVIGQVGDIGELARSMAVDAVLIAMPSAPRATMDEIVRVCADRHIPCRTLPALHELADGRVEVARLRPVTVEDVLGRESVKLDEVAVCGYLKDKRVAVTGGGGSIGGELCRQVLEHDPRELLIVESSEFNLYSIERELTQRFPGKVIRPVLADVRVRPAIDRIFAQFGPEVVFHTAAYKHVPIVEDNILEAVRNNVFGTKNVADAAVVAGVSKFVQVSTDKTVNPANIMGATKRIAEVYCQMLNGRVETDFVTTRFGNVLGSAGSVVSVFEQQISAGGPVTVTHPDITRYFMTISEAVALILQAGSMGKGGEIYVMDMGRPVRIRELAENMIRLSGLEPGRDIPIEYIGLRPGEKMHEELFYEKEELVGTGHPKLMLANCTQCREDEVQSGLESLEKAIQGLDKDAVLRGVQGLVPELKRYIPPRKADIVPLKPPQAGRTSRQ